MSKTIQCPQCGNDTIYSPENEFRPFCSRRCKMTDLGTWADEGYKVPTVEPPAMTPETGDDTQDESYSPVMHPLKDLH